MSERVLFRVPNALETKRPLPLPLGPTLWQFTVFLVTLFGSLVLVALDLLLDRNILDDLTKFLIVCAFAIMTVSFKLGGHMLPYWLWTLNRLSTLRVIGRLSWGWLPMKTKDEVLPGGPPRKNTVLIAGNWAHVLYENARVLDDGVLDVSGIPLLPRWMRAIVSVFVGRAAYRKVIDVGLAALADLEDRQSQERLLRVRSSFWFRLNQTASAHSVVKPLDPEVIAYSAGPEEQAARDLAAGNLEGQENGLIGRHNYLVVQGAVVWLLNRNVKKAIATLTAHGRSSRVLSSEELERIISDEWGPRRRLPLEIGPGFVRFGAKRLVSYLLYGLERNIPLDWLLGFLDGSVPNARIALYQQPVVAGGPFGALARLTWRVTAWRAATLGFDVRQYENAIADAERIQDEIREPSGSLHRWGIVLTVPEEHKEYVEGELNKQYLTSDGWRAAYTVEDSAAKATLPLGVDAYVDRRYTNSSTLGLSTPWAGSALWRPPIDGKPTAVLLGYSLATAEPVGWYPFDNRDTAGQEAWNAFLWGMMGDGKTTTVEMIGRRVCKPHPNHYLAELKPRGLFIDHKPDLEYGGLVTDLGGQYIIADSWSDVRDINIEQTALGINISRIHPRNRGRFTYDLIRKVMDGVSARSALEPWPGLIAVDEMHILALTEEGRWVISELGKMVRSAWFSVLFATQDMDDVLRRDETAGEGADGLVAAAIKNASCRIALRQPTLTRNLLLDRLQMSHAEVDFLTYMSGEDGGEIRSSRGKCLVWAHGRKAPTQIVPLGQEREIFAQDPQNRLALARKRASVTIDDPESSEHDPAGMGSLLAGGASIRTRRARSYRVAGARPGSRRYRRS